MKFLTLYNQALDDARRVKASAAGADWIDREAAHERLALLDIQLGDLAHCCIALGDYDVSLADLPSLREQFKDKTVYGRNHWWSGLHLIEAALHHEIQTG